MFNQIKTEYIILAQILASLLAVQIFAYFSYITVSLH